MGEDLKIIRAAVYARVSTDKDDQTNSLESQKSYFAQYINEHSGWILTNVYYDTGISGTQTCGRAGFNAMIDEALHGKIDLILTKEVCRFARNTIDTLFYTRKLKEAGVGVIFTIDNINTLDCDGELRLTIMACIAQEESRKTSERVKWGQKRRMEQGIVFGGNMLGYTVKGGVMTINEEEARIVRAIFHKYTNEGKGTYIIAKELLEEGMYPKNACEWSAAVILRVLKNEKYVGDLCQKKTITPNFLTHTKKRNSGEEEMIYLTDHHEPIIDRQLWNRTQARIKARSHTGFLTPEYGQNEDKRNGQNSRCWCGGRIYCAECKSRFVSRVKVRADKSVYRAWRCHTAACKGTLKISADGRTAGCDNISINEKSLLACVYYAISMVPVDFERLKNEALEEAAETVKASAKRDRRRILADIEILNQKKKKAIDLMLDKCISKADLDRQLQWYDDEIKILDGEFNRADQKDIMKQYADAIDKIMDFNDNISGDAHFICRETLDRIEIYKNKVVVVKLKCIPFAIEMTIRSGGKMEKFHTEIINSKICKIN